MRKVLLLVGVTLVLAAGPAVAQSLDLPIKGMEIGMVQWHPFRAGEAITLDPAVCFHPYAPVGPETPTNLGEIVPWLKARGTVDVIGELRGDPPDSLRIGGFGISASAKIGSIWGAPGKAGIGYRGGSGWGWYPGVTFSKVF